MRSIRTWKTALGMTALLVTLALTSPGVQLARAGDGDSAAAASSRVSTPAPEPGRVALPSAAPVCRPANGDAVRSASDLANLAVVRLQQQLAVQAAAAALVPADDSPPSDGIVLNNRGYNYGSTAGR